MGAGMGVMMPAMFAQYFSGKGPQHADQPTPPPGEKGPACQECGHPLPPDAKFCHQCGHQQVVFGKCGNCGKNLTPNAKFCSRCGHPAEEKPAPNFCPGCGAENLPESKFCNRCGEKIVP
jgi:predicted amidophosphoribosyltransferase